MSGSIVFHWQCFHNTGQMQSKNLCSFNLQYILMVMAISICVQCTYVLCEILRRLSTMCTNSLLIRSCKYLVYMWQAESTMLFDIVLPSTRHLTKICTKTFRYCYKFDKIKRWTRQNPTNLI